MKNEAFPIPNNIPVNAHHSSYLNRADKTRVSDSIKKLPEILFITSYPPRECGIATYSQDLIKALNKKFNKSFTISICPLESNNEQYTYADVPKYKLNTDDKLSPIKLAFLINKNPAIEMVVLQHEFGFFANNEDNINYFLDVLTKPVVIAFHTVLPRPEQSLKFHVQEISMQVEKIVVMTNASMQILIDDYKIPASKIMVIPHGTHLVLHSDKETLKNKYNLSGKKVLSTFGLLGSGKSIETTLRALPAIVEKNPEAVFLIIGKTHPTIIIQEGEKYRQKLEAMIEELNLKPYVRFINHFLPLPDLLEYLQLTDLYLFTSNDPNQAVSGTFSYAVSCGCAIISTPIPHACEVLQNNVGIIIDFDDSLQLSKVATNLLNDENRRKEFSSNALHKMAFTSWENSAIAHGMLFEKITKDKIKLKFNLPLINLDHIKKLTDDFAMIQFSKINQPDIDSGYTLDDNARAMIAMCQHFELTSDKADLEYIIRYFNFIKYCLRPEGYFLNYVDEQKLFTAQNNSANLADANGRAIWALGYLVSMNEVLPADLIAEAELVLKTALLNTNKIYSTRAMAFIIKGLFFYNKKTQSERNKTLLIELADRIVQMYKHEADKNWLWFEGYLTYANSILPEAMLCAWLVTNDLRYKEIAKSSFDFLLSKILGGKSIKVISNKNWMQREGHELPVTVGGEQPIDVAYTVIALGKFYEAFQEESYLSKMHTAFDWFLGNNHLHQIIYNPCTGGCYDGLEENNVNLNQGAESTVSYLMARLTVEKFTKDSPMKDEKRKKPVLKLAIQNVISK
jgi:glycosyltransferase involved in cell wall biosynthesis